MSALCNNFISYRAFLARKYGRWGRVSAAQDEIDFETHDKRYHGGKYDPATQTCLMRQKLEEGDLADVLVAEQEEIRYARKKWKQAEKERKRTEREAKSAEVERKTLSELSSRTYTDEDRRMVNEAMRHVLTEIPAFVSKKEAVDAMISFRANKSGKLVENIGDYFKREFPDGIIIPGIGRIDVNKNSAKSIVTHSTRGQITLPKFGVLTNLKRLLESSRCFAVNARWKGRTYDSLNFATAVRLGDEDKIIEFTVIRKPDGGQELYNVKIVPKENVEECRRLVAAPKSDRGKNFSSTPHIIPQSVGGGNGENEEKANMPNRGLPSSNLVRQYLAANGLLDGYGK